MEQVHCQIFVDANRKISQNASPNRVRLPNLFSMFSLSMPTPTKSAKPCVCVCFSPHARHWVYYFHEIVNDLKIFYLFNATGTVFNSMEKKVPKSIKNTNNTNKQQLEKFETISVYIKPTEIVTKYCHPQHSSVSVHNFHNDGHLYLVSFKVKQLKVFSSFE